MKIQDIKIKKCNTDFAESLAEAVHYMKRDLTSLPRVIGQFVLWGEKANYVQLTTNRFDDNVDLSLAENGKAAEFIISIEMVE